MAIELSDALDDLSNAIKALRALTPAADRLPYFTGADAAALATFTAAARNLLDDADAAAMRTTLGLAIGTDVQAYDADLSTWAGVTPGTGVTTALAANVGSAGAVVTNGGALGTPSSGTLTNATGLPLSGITSSTSTPLGVGSLELGHASDTTLARAAAGVMSVEGRSVGQLVASSGVQVAHTGDTALTTLITKSIPGGLLGPNGFLRVTFLVTCTSNANTKGFHVTYGGTTFFFRNETTNALGRHQIQITNRGATNSQVAAASGLAGGFSAGNLSTVTSSIDTDSAQDLLFRVQLGNSGDTARFESYSVEAFYAP